MNDSEWEKHCFRLLPTLTSRIATVASVFDPLTLNGFALHHYTISDVCHIRLVLSPSPKMCTAVRGISSLSIIMIVVTHTHGWSTLPMSYNLRTTNHGYVVLSSTMVGETGGLGGRGADLGFWDCETWKNIAKLRDLLAICKNL